MNESFDGKVALVTGSGSGIGLATAKAFADAGASVVLAGHQEASVCAAAEDLVAAGHTALAIRCDVADKRQVAAMVEQTVSPADGWMRRSTMPACRALSQKPLMPAAKHTTACM
jgi:NAD(P)-dependent dehydrogenase (short-subunit alcohol dehydrogenase family)